MPAIGLGTYKLTNDKNAIVQAIVSAGYRHIDTASKYDNEELVGEAI
jgi:diketogulonate reductase-like aldo/keto reductase